MKSSSKFVTVAVIATSLLAVIAAASCYGPLQHLRRGPNPDGLEGFWFIAISLFVWVVTSLAAMIYLLIARKWRDLACALVMIGIAAICAAMWVR